MSESFRYGIGGWYVKGCDTGRHGGISATASGSYRVCEPQTHLGGLGLLGLAKPYTHLKDDRGENLIEPKLTKSKIG